MAPAENVERVTVLEIIQRSTSFLEAKGVESPRLQIELMLAHTLNMPRLKLYLNFERALSEVELDRLREMVKRRAAREPLQHILGSTSFCGLEIKCSRAALVPRPETELLAERAWKYLLSLSAPASLSPQRGEGLRVRGGDDQNFLSQTKPQDLSPLTPALSPLRGEGEGIALDLGAGTGCIAIAIAKNTPGVMVLATDISADALALAKENAAHNKVSERITFHLGDGFTSLLPDLKFDLIISNPPYIAVEEIASLQPEVRDFDPKLALDGGADGLEFYRRIATEARPFLKPQGKLMLEFGDGQADDIKKIFSREKWIVDEIVADYSSRPRILIARPGD